MPGAAKWSVSAGSQYKFSIGNFGTLTLRADIHHRSSYEFLFPNGPVEGENGYTIANARAIFSPLNTKWELQLFGKNIGNTKYKSFGIDNTGFGGGTTAVFAPPQEWGANFLLRF